MRKLQKIMTVPLVYDTVTFGTEVFDVVIIDESSQCSIDSIPIWSLGKKVIVIGDNRQISPERPGISEENKAELPKRYLEELTPAVRRVLAVESNMYDIAEVIFPAAGFIRLKEHFRCMPEIIGYNNKFFYSDNPMIPLKKYTGQRLEPPIRTCYIDDGYVEGNEQNRHNPVETERIVKSIVQCCNDPAYVGKTMGVIALQGRRQYKEIGIMLSNRLGLDEIENRKIVCGNAYSFQGDERDVIFLSMIIAKNATYNAMTRDMYEKIFNVAVSRAKDQIWLFHSVKEADLSPTCLRRKLLEYFGNYMNVSETGIELDKLNQQAYTENRTQFNRPEPFDSWFEVDVFLALANRSYRVVPQYKVADKRIDMVVEGNSGKQLAVECDGDYYHTPDTDWNDLWRQTQLERLGWEFFRIKEWEFRKDPDFVIDILTTRLDKIGITPTTEWEDSIVNSKDPEEEKEVSYDTNGLHIAQEYQNEYLPEDSDRNLFTKKELNSESNISTNEKIVNWPDPRSDSQHNIAEKMIEIVENHGPLLDELVYKIYLSKVGLKKLGNSLRRIFQNALKGALRTRRIEQVSNWDTNAVIVKTPQQQNVVIRKIVSRDFYLIPPNEIAQLAVELKKQVLLNDDETLYRMILDYYGVGRLTRKAVHHLTKTLNR